MSIRRPGATMREDFAITSFAGIRWVTALTVVNTTAPASRLLLRARRAKAVIRRAAIVVFGDTRS